jgi:hypothetical protein
MKWQERACILGGSGRHEMAKRKITDVVEARRCVEAAQRAGQTLTVWAREHGVDGRSLRGWPRRLGHVLPGPVKDVGIKRALVELVLRPDPVVAARYSLAAQGIRFEFGEDASAAMLQRVVGVLRSC